MSNSLINRQETLSDVFTYPLMKTAEKTIWEATNSIMKNASGLDGVAIRDENSFVGIEVEVEGIHGEVGAVAPFWKLIEDGSLRNHGYEFVSTPIKGKAIPAALHQLKTELTRSSPKHDFSERTSVHVHMNVRDLTCESFMTMLMTYLVFESTLYKFIFDTCGRKRSDNIFCVPIQESGVTSMALDRAILLFERGDNKLAMHTLNSSWKKYAGINLVPIRSFGTVEFRHLGGIMDIGRIMTWINLLLSIKKHSIAFPYEMIKDRILGLNTTSMYDMFTKEVFGQYADSILRYNVQQELEKGVNYVKYAFDSAQDASGEKTDADFRGPFETSLLKEYVEKQEGITLQRKEPEAKKNYRDWSSGQLYEEALRLTDKLDRLERRVRGRITRGDETAQDLDFMFKEVNRLRGERSEINNELKRRKDGKTNPVSV